MKGWMYGGREVWVDRWMDGWTEALLLTTWKHGIVSGNVSPLRIHLIVLINNYWKPTASHCVQQGPRSMCSWPHSSFKLRKTQRANKLEQPNQLLKIMKSTLMMIIIIILIFIFNSIKLERSKLVVPITSYRRSPGHHREEGTWDHILKIWILTKLLDLLANFAAAKKGRRQIILIHISIWRST